MEQEEEPQDKKRTWRCLISFWIFGLCNNYGYVVMLTAAADIIGETGVNPTNRKLKSFKLNSGGEK